MCQQNQIRVMYNMKFGNKIEFILLLGAGCVQFSNNKDALLKILFLIRILKIGFPISLRTRDLQEYELIAVSIHSFFEL